MTAARGTVRRARREYLVRAAYGAEAEKLARPMAARDYPDADALQVTWRGWAPDRAYHRVAVEATYNPPGFYAPWTSGNRSAYHAADSVAAARAGFSRARKLQAFILRGELTLPCGRCGARLCDPIPPDPAIVGDPDGPHDSARGWYDPRSGRVAVMHYTCSWLATITDILRKGAA